MFGEEQVLSCFIYLAGVKNQNVNRHLCMYLAYISKTGIWELYAGLRSELGPQEAIKRPYRPP